MVSPNVAPGVALGLEGLADFTVADQVSARRQKGKKGQAEKSKTKIVHEGPHFSRVVPGPDVTTWGTLGD
jgi:hypothetical protein